MSDSVWLALITASAGVLGAGVGALASILGPVWTESRRLAHQAATARDDRRYERALEFIEAAATLAGGVTWANRKGASLARARFVAVLRPGEANVVTFTEQLLVHVEGERDLNQGIDILAIVSACSNQLFAYLRGDVPATDLDVIATRRAAKL